MTPETTTPTSPAPRSPRRFGGAALAAVALASAALGTGGALLLLRRGGEAAPGHDHPPAVKYTCPMHPTVVQDHPGDCPICGMKLVPASAGAGPAPSAAPAAADAAPVYTCPMHPSVVQDHPGNCPICGMKLVQAGAKATGAADERTVLFYRSPMDPKVTSHVPARDEMGMDYLPVYADEAGVAPVVPGLSEVTIDPSRQQLIGLRTAPVARGPVGGAWRTVGRVAMDETRVRHINLKVPGFVERVYVDFVGKLVRRGEPLFTIYSPELLSAQEEYLLALRTRGGLGEGGLAHDGDALVAAARRKLELWDVSTSEIDEIERTGKPVKNLTLRSPISGVVTKKDVVDGMKLDAGAMPYELVDLSAVWVLADVYESELRFVRLGMPATLTLNAYPDRPFRGKVVFVDPLLDPKSRTVKVRLEFPNPGGELRPEMFGEVVLQGQTREGLRVPADAVVDSGTKKVVFVAVGEGKFRPREIRIGVSDGASVEVISGLVEGEQVVTRGNFLVDSESRLRASLAELTAGSPPAKPERARVLPSTSGASESASAGPAPGAAAPAAAPPAPSGGHPGHAGHGGGQP
ncbi:MAG TPA: efflux RND transporter periplasmic adaptor subunit [Anaeromyxobacteraceae bacterium]|nr:efflux RND transporter periplasmic adaptor subunit [Anaeromyxobacteraceae bacterium]